MTRRPRPPRRGATHRRSMAATSFGASVSPPRLTGGAMPQHLQAEGLQPTSSGLRTPSALTACLSATTLGRRCYSTSLLRCLSAGSSYGNRPAKAHSNSIVFSRPEVGQGLTAKRRRRPGLGPCARKGGPNGFPRKGLRPAWLCAGPLVGKKTAGGPARRTGRGKHREPAGERDVDRRWGSKCSPNTTVEGAAVSGPRRNSMPQNPLWQVGR